MRIFTGSDFGADFEFFYTQKLRLDALSPNFCLGVDGFIDTIDCTLSVEYVGKRYSIEIRGMVLVYKIHAANRRARVDFILYAERDISRIDAREIFALVIMGAIIRHGSGYEKLLLLTDSNVERLSNLANMI